MRPERCWPLAVGVLRWTRAPRGVWVGRNYGTVVWSRLMIGPSRWRAHTRPLSGAGSARPTPNRYAESTSTDRSRRAMMAGDR